MPTNSLTYHNPQLTLFTHQPDKSAYTYHIDVVGTGGDTCVCPISDSLSEKWNRRGEAALVKACEPKPNWEGAPQGLMSDLPVWARRSHSWIVWGVDMFADHNIMVTDDDGKCVFALRYKPSMPQDVFQNWLKTQPDLYHTSVANLHVETYEILSTRFTIKTNKRFNENLLRFCAERFNGRHLLNSIEYDGIEHHKIYNTFKELRPRMARIIPKLN